MLCQDILLEVLNYLSPSRRHPSMSDDKTTQKSRVQCRRTLVACAPVSKFMSHHALNALWAAAHQVWEELTVKEMDRAMGSMVERVAAVKAAKGYQTRF